MGFKPLTHLFKGDGPDEEREHTLQAAPSQDSQRGTTDGDDASSEHEVDDHEDDDESGDALPDVELGTQPTAKPRGFRAIYSRIHSAVFPSPSNDEEIQAYIPHYRILPILSGIAIPFCILLEIPGLTSEWYIRTEGSAIVASKHNSPLGDAGIALSILCALAANFCLVVRFLEKRIKTMTILCTVFLSIHDAINVAALAAFGVHKGDYTYGHAFWMTLCSTILSMFTNVTLIIDLIKTPDFKQSGSGLTRRQRSLVIIIIGLFCYIALGALVNSLLLHLTFINALYFTVVTIETIGFGDIVPNTRSSRVFVCFYATLGVINVAFVVGYVRQAVLEGLDFGYRIRLLAIQEKRRAALRRRRAENRWRHAVIWRLRERRQPVWIPNSARSRESPWLKLKSILCRVWRVIWSTVRRSIHQSAPRRGMKLNVWALPRCQLEAAALEAGVPLDTLLPAGFYDTYDYDSCHHDAGAEHHTFPSWFVVHSVYHHDERTDEPLTYHRLGSMAVMLTRLSFSIYESGGGPLPNGDNGQDAGDVQGSSGTLQSSSSEDRDYRADVVDVEKSAYYKRSGLSWGWFFIFWMGGAYIFKTTEGWTYGSAVYFCFISFTTIGYGDLAPTTPAGRCIFVVWALVGVATITIFVSVVSEAYTSRYESILGRDNFKRVVQQYHKRTKVDLSDKLRRISTALDVNDTFEPREEGDPSRATVAASTLKPNGNDRHVEHVRRPLEQLPRQILIETRAIQQLMRLMGDLDGQRQATKSGRPADETVWRLVDDVMGERRLTESTKGDILKDGECRQALMMLGIERSLKELVSASEQAIAAIREQERIIAASEQGNGTG